MLLYQWSGSKLLYSSQARGGADVSHNKQTQTTVFISHFPVRDFIEYTNTLSQLHIY